MENKCIYFAQDRETGNIYTEPFFVSGIGDGDVLAFQSCPDKLYPVDRFMLVSVVVSVPDTGENKEKNNDENEYATLTLPDPPQEDKEQKPVEEIDQKAKEWDGFKKPVSFPVRESGYEKS